MDNVAFGMQIQDLLEEASPDVGAVLAVIGEQIGVDAKASGKAFSALVDTVAKAKDLKGAVDCVGFYAAHLTSLTGFTTDQMRMLVRETATTAEEKQLIDSIGLNTAIPSAIARRLSVLLALKPGVYVCSQSWGFGQVQKIDSFYGKVILNFEGKPNHAMSLAVAGQNLSIADDNHLMTRYMRDKESILEMAQKHPGELVRLTLQSYGPLSVPRLADKLAEVGLVKPADWKSFWEAARRSLKADKQHPVEIPTKRSEPIQLLDAEEDYGEKWVKRFAKERNIKAIFEGVLAMLAYKKTDKVPDEAKTVVTNRLNFALKGADKTDYARYAQIAVLLRRLGLSTEEEQIAQADTLTEKDEQDNLLLAMRGLAARDVSALVAFLIEVKPENKAIVLAHLPLFNSVALGATLTQLAGDDETGDAVRALLARQATPVPTLVVWALRNRSAAIAWNVPSLNELLTQAIHIVEQRLSGENLKMRNALQAFFDSARWLEEVCKELTAFDRQVMFERIQASTSWDTASQRNILVRMCRFDSELAKLRRSVKTPQEHQHLTSLRSLTAYKLAYEHLINVEIPANTRDIATARSYGDLRENAEYQFAKDHQRVLLSKQDEMDRTLKLLKVTDFSNVSTAEAAMGTKVTVDSAEGKLTYTILGELDRDESLNIISCRSRLAEALMGKAVGATVELPSEKGTLVATIAAIEPLDDTVKGWLAQIPTVYDANA